MDKVNYTLPRWLPECLVCDTCWKFFLEDFEILKVANSISNHAVVIINEFYSGELQEYLTKEYKVLPPKPKYKRNDRWRVQLATHAFRRNLALLQVCYG